ncbi:NADH-quinone oxidoreductase subunit L [Monaibacterium marinum]|uniref:NADH-quinone oxidoreductase subunit L n=1 Tax=Pontivivens marinum TaxID=1690039 RepID=A0A2C9CVZ8_9RHOB|nr:NADH-quinone oxidoreductase subunit L [Monaibacterium marinum]SOH95393.1 NADH-quinone oxidoreductase subunit L [Monaibacterium marinum]
MYHIILFAPLLAAIIAGFGWRVISEKGAQFLTTGSVILAAFLSWIAFITADSGLQIITIARWIDSGSMVADWAIRVDMLTNVMLVVITTVSALVHLYSFGYMDNDPQWRKGEVYKPRFFAYLSFFTFAMLMLVTADNLVQMFFGWEGVGVASYLLIGFYWRKPTAGAAAMKAFIVNRVGDFGFALGIFALFLLTDSVDFTTIFGEVGHLAATTINFLGMELPALEVVGFLLFIGAMGKSAQLLLHTWLPDAMEGPTPVSALIHAATMVTAGVFLVCRMSPIFEEAIYASAFITTIGAITAFFAATVGLVQNDIKRVIAYSTCSQLGYMFVAAGVGFYQAAMFHLFTHAAFKAMLFLGAGSVIHAMHHEQDMRNYGGLRHKIPKTFWAMMLGTLAITGVGIPFSYDLIGLPIGFAGFVSKDAIIEGAFAGHAYFAFTALVVAALFTSFYSWRLMFLTFYGKPRGDQHTHDHAHESPWVMTVPLGVLAIGAVFAGMLYYNSFVGHDAEEFFGDAIGGPAVVELHAEAGDAVDDGHGEVVADGHAGDEHADDSVLHSYHYVPSWVKLAPFIAMLAGLGIAYQLYIRSPQTPARLGAALPGLYRFLLNKWYFDEIYDVLFVRSSKWLGRFLWRKGDGAVIDGGINGLAMGIIPFLTRIAGRAQSGYVFHYAFAMIAGLVAIITWFAIRGAS